MTTRHRVASVLLICLAFQALGAGQQDELARARELYAAASYDEALVVLDHLRTEPNGANSIEVTQYRMYCLIALERGDETKQVIESIVTADPFYSPPEAQASPRIRSVFNDTRRALLPVVVQRVYADAKAAFDKGDPQAREKFDVLLKLLDDPDLRGNAMLSDLRTVATGFRDLSGAAASGKAAGAKEQGIAAPPVVQAGGEPPPAPTTAARALPTGADNQGDHVTLPVTLAQPLPPWRSVGRKELTGKVKVTIDAKGNVTSAEILQSIDPNYDSELLRFARTWRYVPASVNGVPIAYVKIVEVKLDPSQK
jgi:TonB family protein